MLRQPVLALLGAWLLGSCLGCVGPSGEGSGFAWRVIGDELVSEGFGVALVAPPSSFRWDGAEDWGEPFLLEVKSSLQQANMFLSAHPLKEGESLPNFARELLPLFAQDGALEEVSQEKLEGREVSGWKIGFTQTLTGYEDERPRRRLIGLYHRAGRVFILKMDTPLNRAEENVPFFERTLRSFRFLGNPKAAEPALAGARSRFQWFEHEGWLWNGGHGLAVAFDYREWTVPEVDAPPTGVILRMIAADGESSRLVERYRSEADLAAFARGHLAELRTQAAFTEKASLEGTAPFPWRVALFENARQKQANRGFLYLYARHGEDIVILSEVVPDLREAEGKLAAYPRNLRLRGPVLGLEAERLFFRGYAAFQQGDSAAAENAYRKARGLDQSHPKANWGLGILAFDAKNYPRAAGRLMVALESPELPAPLQESGWQRLGQASLQLNEHEQAVAAFRQLGELKPTDALPRFLLAQAHASLAQPEALEAALVECLLLAQASDARRGTDFVSSYLGFMARDPIISRYADRPWFRDLVAEHGEPAAEGDVKE